MSTADIKTIIADDIEITGSIKCASNIQIDGKLNGDLACTGDAVLGHSGSVKGNLNVNSITVQGQVNGNITAKDKIDLKSTARITGDIRSKRLTVEDGVSFVGKAEVNPSGATARAATDKAVQEISPEEEPAGDTEAQRKNNSGIFGRK